MGREVKYVCLVVAVPKFGPAGSSLGFPAGKFVPVTLADPPTNHVTTRGLFLASLSWSFGQSSSQQ